MAVTDPSDVATSIPEIWAKLTLREHLPRGFWGQLTGPEGSGAPIIQRVDLVNNPGDLLHIQVTNPLSGAGIEGDTATLEGNEEDLTTSEIKVSPVLYRHGVLLNRRAQKKSILDLRKEARFRLAEWGMDKMDDKRFSLFAASALPAPLSGDPYTPNAYVVGGGAGVDDVAVGEVLTVAAVQEIKLKLRLQRARPVMVNGHEVFFLVTHLNAMHQLKRETEYRDWVREAEIRGKDNPFFRGALAMLDGVVLFDHERVPVVTNATSVKVAQGLAFGSEAFVEGVDENPSWDEDIFDYGHRFGMAYAFACQPRRALELSSVQVYTEAPDTP